MTRNAFARRRSLVVRIALRLRRAHMTDRITVLGDLVGMPGDLARAASARIERLSRRTRAIDRLIG